MFATCRHYFKDCDLFQGVILKKKAFSSSLSIATIHSCVKQHLFLGTAVDVFKEQSISKLKRRHFELFLDPQSIVCFKQ